MNAADLCCSVAGIYVAQLGLNSSRSIDPSTIQKYVQGLTILAIMCILMRIAWVFDIVLLVETAVKNSNSKTTTTDPTVTDDYGTDSNKPMSDKIVVTFGIQVKNEIIHHF